MITVRVEQLRYLHAIIRHSSYRRAAEELDIAQPSLSQAIKQLEYELGARLLERGRSGVRLTDVGRSVLPHVERMLEVADAMRDEVAGHAGLLRGYLQVGTVGSGTNTLLPQVLAEFCREHPGVDVFVREGGSLDIVSAVRSGDLEMGLVINEVGKPYLQGLEAVELLSSPLVICVDSRNALRKRPSVTLEQLSRERLILFRSGYLMHEVVSDLIQRHQVRAVFHTDNTESAKRMVAAGVGVMLFPEFSIIDDTYRQLEKVAYIPLAGNATTIQLCLVKRGNRPLSPAGAVVWRMLIQEAHTVQRRRVEPVLAAAKSR